jgi:hypothetical protein
VEFVGCGRVGGGLLGAVGVGSRRPAGMPCWPPQDIVSVLV